MKSISRLTALLVLFALFLSACGGTATPPPATVPTAAPACLRLRVLMRRILDDAVWKIPGATAGYLATSARSSLGA